MTNGDVMAPSLPAAEDVPSPTFLWKKATLRCSWHRSISAIENFFRIYIASSKHDEGLKNSRQLCKLQMRLRVCITFENSSNPKCLDEAMITRKKYSTAFIKYFSKFRACLKRHIRVYILPFKHIYQPMSERVVSRLFYNYLSFMH